MKSSCRVMVVDDSAVIRGLLTRFLEEDPAIEVVASVPNGKVAIARAASEELDVVVLDIEMPVMDGLTALPKIIAAKPGIQVIMASTLTRQNAEVSLRALKQGAADYITKPSSSSELHSTDAFRRDLVGKVKALGEAARTRVGEPRPAASRPSPAPPQVRAAPPARPTAAAIRLRPAATLPPKAIAIGSSTGGPQALIALLSELPPRTRLPIFITQHMPATFTTLLAEHIAKASGIPCSEGKDGEPVLDSPIYLAPGDFHMEVVADAGGPRLRLHQGPQENFCRPAVDPMLRSLAAIYGRHLLVIILTGMGMDGKRGSEVVVERGGSVIAQDEASSVVWGMPGAVATAGLCSSVLPLPEIAPYLRTTLLRSAA